MTSYTTHTTLAYTGGGGGGGEGGGEERGGGDFNSTVMHTDHCELLTVT